MMRLCDHHRVPPGEYWYEQDFTAGGRNLHKRWKPTPDVGGLAAKVAVFRKGNNLPRSSVVDALEDIDAYTCNRLGNNPKWVMDTETAWDQLVAAAHGPNCKTCGGYALNQ